MRLAGAAGFWPDVACSSVSDALPLQQFDDSWCAVTLRGSAQGSSEGCCVTQQHLQWVVDSSQGDDNCCQADWHQVNTDAQRHGNHNDK